MNVRNTAAAVTVVLLAGAGPAFANDETGLVLQSQYVSEYVFRGVTRSADAVQTSAEASYGNLTAGAWTSFAIDDNEGIFTDEINLYVASGWTLGDDIGVDVGATLYHFPQTGDFFSIGDEEGDGSTIEIYGGLDFDTLFNPSATAYYDVSLETITLEGQVNYPLSIWDRFVLEPAFVIGLVDDSDDGDVDYQYAEARARLDFNISDRASLFTSAHYAISTEDTFIDTSFSLTDPDSVLNPQRNRAWFSVGLSATY